MEQPTPRTCTLGFVSCSDETTHQVTEWDYCNYYGKRPMRSGRWFDFFFVLFRVCTEILGPQADLEHTKHRSVSTEKMYSSAETYTGTNMVNSGDVKCRFCNGLEHKSHIKPIVSG